MIRNSLFLSCLAFVVILASCVEEDEKITSEQTDAVADQSVTEAYFNDAGDLSTAAYSAPSNSDISGRTSSGRSVTISVSGDTRFNGATITLETPANNNVLNPQGTITIDFGTGQTDPKGITRKGKVVITYKGLRFLPQSIMELTFNGYEVNGIKVEGKRTVTTTALDNTGITFAVKDVGAKVTFADGTFVTREATLSHKWQFGDTLSKNQWLVEGTANGQTREKKTYLFTIQKTLVFKVECALNKYFLPAQGEILLTVDTQAIKVDYGAGDCDDKVMLTVNGISQEITVNN
jgi:hypothetical protein